VRARCGAVSLSVAVSVERLLWGFIRSSVYVAWPHVGREPAEPTHEENINLFLECISRVTPPRALFLKRAHARALTALSGSGHRHRRGARRWLVPTVHEDLADCTKRFSFCAISYCAHKTPPLGLTSRDANHDAWIAERTTPVATVEQEEINTGRTQLPRES
jgi:hypothetical protein